MLSTKTRGVLSVSSAVEFGSYCGEQCTGGTAASDCEKDYGGAKEGC